MKGWRTAVAVAAFVASLATARPAAAGFLEDAGWGSLTVLTNLVYMPVKLVYATLGGLTGGLAYGLTAGDLQTAETVWVTAMGGTYVVTPGMLQGQDPISFAGSPTASTTTAAPTAPSAATADNSDHKLDEQPLGGS
jgi:hypothetical protein